MNQEEKETDSGATTVDHLENTREVRTQGKVSRKIICLLITVFIVIAGTTFGVLYAVDT